MPVTEIATISLIAGSNVADPESNAGVTWRSICQTVSRQDNFQSLFFGHEVENPPVVQLFVNWDSLEAHKKFMASDEYGPMVERLKHIMDGSPAFIHYDFESAGALSQALSAPVTELATFYLPSKSASFQTNVEKFSKAVSEEKPAGFSGIATAWSLEDVEHEGLGAGNKGKALLLALGWESVEAHMAYRETDHFKANIDLLRGEPKGVELHHTAMKTL